MVLRLFQVKKSAKSLQDPVSKKKPLFQDIPKNLQKPLQDDEPFRTRAATNPSSPAAGILIILLILLISSQFSLFITF